MKSIALCLFFICCFERLPAQNDLPPAYVITTDSLFQELAPQQWQMLDDKEGKWTISEVSKPPISTQFHFKGEAAPSRYSEVKTFWFRYRLKNGMNQKLNISLDSYSDKDDYYVFDQQGRSRHFITGRAVPWKKKDGLKERNYIPIVLEPGEEVVVYDRSSNYKRGFPEQLKISIVNTDKVIQRDFVENQDDLVEVFFQFNYFAFGFFLLAACFNFLFYRTAREKTYLYLALHLLFLCLEIFLEGFSRSLPRIQLYKGVPIWISQFFFLHFVRYYFQTFLLRPRWDIFLRALSIFLILYVIVILIFPGNPDILFISRIISLILLPLIFLITYSIFSRSDKKAAFFFAIAMLPYILFQIITGTVMMLDAVQVNLPRLFQWYFANTNELGTVSAAWLVLLFTWALFKRYDQQRKEIAQKELEKERLAREQEMEKSKMIEEQNIELEKRVEERTARLKESLEDLKNTQAQLIQSEKMASLGELTAGIAHEIQNPLNFVNNFSEVNKELAVELKAELATGNMQSAKEFADSIIDNADKINHHGKRADAIVKGMLQHSRSSSGQKELTDINALADEYLRLAYHGLRAKDKSFNSRMETEFDPAAGSMNIVPQDIGRVILNLITNAFYVVNEKAKQGNTGYEPIVTVSTKKLNGKIEITVKDNGNGIPQKVLDKIFQPFFTTKPTGQGTGLGLSLSYDIIKAHGGEIKVVTKEGEGSEFITQLPIV